ncbi:MAG: hypothetical protein R3A51_10435 [Nannocystaceae bacterium]
MLYQLLIGVTPFRGDTVLEVLSQHALDDLVPPREAASDADIPESVEAIVMRCLARNPDDRFQTASELEVGGRRTDRRADIGHQRRAARP